MPRLTRHWPRATISVSVFAALFLAVACGSDDDPGVTPESDLEAAYFAGLSKVVEILDETNDELDDYADLISPDFVRRDVQADVERDVIRALHIDSRTAEMAGRARALVPSERFAKDHAVYLEHLDAQVVRAMVIEEALDEKNLPTIHRYHTELVAESWAISVDVSDEFCRLVLPNEVPGDTDLNPRERFCDKDSVPGGEYGAAVNRVATRWVTQFAPRTGPSSIMQGLEGDELLEVVAQVQPYVTDLFSKTLEELDAIDPPPEYEVSHRFFRAYITDLQSTVAAINEAVADGDGGRLEDEIERSREITEEADEGLPDNYRPIVKSVFGETSDSED